MIILIILIMTQIQILITYNERRIYAVLYNDFFTSMVLNEANGKPTDGVTPPDDPPDFTKEQQPDAGADPNAAPPDNADAAEQAPPEEQPQDDQGGDPNAEGQPEEDPNAAAYSYHSY